MNCLELLNPELQAMINRQSAVVPEEECVRGPRGRPMNHPDHFAPPGLYPPHEQAKEVSYHPSDYSFGEDKMKAMCNIEGSLVDVALSDQEYGDFYPDEVTNLMHMASDVNAYGKTAMNEQDIREQLLLLSLQADKELMRKDLQMKQNHVHRGRAYQRPQQPPAAKTPTDLWCGAGRPNTPASPSSRSVSHTMLQEHLQGFGEKRPDHWEPPQEDQNRKRRLCRHFLKGHCKRGKACDFLHDSSIFCPDLQKVFLGGLPAHITEATLRSKLSEQGYTVINKPKVLRGFTPQVCLGSVEEAQRLIEKGKINIDGSLVDVRPYEAFAKDNLDKKLPDDIKRSVFLGGLANGTTGQMIKDDLETMDVKVVNHPIIKTGFTPMVTVGTVEQAQMLIKLKKVLINDTLVDVRPYVNFRKRY